VKDTNEPPECIPVPWVWSLPMRLMSSLLFKVTPVDPVTYGAACLGLIATAALASYLPSRRVAAVDPVEALRAE